MNGYRKDFIKRAILAAAGLFVFSIGEYMGLIANIGLAPWACFAQGLCNYIPLPYGTVFTITSVIILIIDILIKERIGIGTILDAVLVGTYVDLIGAVLNIPQIENTLVGIAVMIIGLFIKALGMVIYMKAALSCGPRDSLLIGLGKRFPKISVGVVNMFLLAAALLVGWLLGGQVGIGTIITIFGLGFAIDIVNRLCRFEPRDIVHEDIFTTFRRLRSRT